ncbi:TA system toxin CbtA family protein [Citrobacter sp. Cb026]|uniref:TA system toxin CbtA family protein n=1 Tax=Citrobacter sp. Cb026 TaxID=2985022 RepID=UPI00257F72D0|nr:TA system toxin CbtA family protein [Citrobacter sp. Cb026]MDM3423925.1 toxin [Citrobacter sp. Cb026]
MQTQPLSSTREASPRPSPVEIWQQLLSHLPDRHYGLTLNDTSSGNDGAIQEHIDAGISLCDAINFIVEKYELVRIDRHGFSAETQSPLIGYIDILRARKACGLITRNRYKAVTNITRGKYSKVQQ